MISYQEALQCVFDSTGSLTVCDTQLSDALNKICAEDLVSTMQLPSFTNSAMDGFAVKSSELDNASEDNPIQLKVIETLAAGETVNLVNNQEPMIAVGINTGAIVPDCFDSVVKIEDLEVQYSPLGDAITVKVTRPIKEQENIRLAGEDVELNEQIIRKGTVIGPAQVMLLSALGFRQLKTFCPPKISIISTGGELLHQAGKPLQHGKIHDANGPYLMAAIRQLGLTVDFYGPLADDAEQFVQLINQISISSDEPHIIISSGAVSKGNKDFIPVALRNLNSEVLFHRVRIKPGKPILFAKLKTGAYFFGLPGNPIATAVGLRFFVHPLIQQIQGLMPHPPLRARLLNTIDFKTKSTTFLKSHLYRNIDGQLIVKMLTGQESFKTKAMAFANTWIQLDENDGKYKPGDYVNVFSLDPSYRQMASLQEDL